MSTQDEKEKPWQQKIDRLRKRLLDFERASPRDAVLIGVVRGMLDLLEDEL